MDTNLICGAVAIVVYAAFIVFAVTLVVSGKRADAGMRRMK